ncbi:hypothetical protein D3C84_551220 [compost metagenome]
MGASERPGRNDVAVVLVLQGHGEALGNPHVVEIHLALRQGALTDLLQGLAPADTGQVQGHDDGDAIGQAIGIVEAVAIVGGHVGQSHLGHRAVGHPGRALAVNDDLVLADLGEEIALVAQLPRHPVALQVEGADISALVRMGNHPAADFPGTQIDQLLVPYGFGHLVREGADAQGNRQTGIAPAHFLADHRLDAYSRFRRQFGQQIGTQAQLGGFAEQAVVRRAGGNHLLCGHLVEFLTKGPHEILGKAMHAVLDAALDLVQGRFKAGY